MENYLRIPASDGEDPFEIKRAWLRINSPWRVTWAGTEQDRYVVDELVEDEGWVERKTYASLNAAIKFVDDQH